MKTIEITDDALCILEEQIGPDYENYSDVILAMHQFCEELVRKLSTKKEKL